MRVVIFRHAERDHDSSPNPGLSPRGKDQASNLLNVIQTHQLTQPQKLLVSPKKRTQETFLSLAKSLNKEVTVEESLDERRPAETSTQFKDRVRKFLHKINCEKQGTIFICSHLDWIEEALIAIPSEDDLLQEKFQTWQPGQYMEFEVHDGLWSLFSTGKI